MAAHGAPVDLEGAAGTGRLDLVAERLAGEGDVSEEVGAKALVMASWYGHADVVTHLVDYGIPVAARTPKDDETALHVASYAGSVDVVRALLSRGAPVDAVDGRFGTPPLVWALHAWLVDGRPDDAGYRQIVRALVEAGATVRREWIDDERLRADAELFALLTARVAEA